MTISRSLSLIAFSTLFSFIIFAVFFFFVEPKEAGVFGLIILFLSLFFSFLGFFTLFIIVLKLRFLKNKEKIFQKISSSFRQAIFISLFLISLLLLKIFKLLEWWSISSSVLFFFLLELIFVTKKKKIIIKKDENDY